MTTDELIDLRDKLLAQLGRAREIETPQLGRVQNRDGLDAARALAVIDAEIAAAGGEPGAGVFVVVSDRGLGGMR